MHLRVVDGQSISRIAVCDAALFREVRESLSLLINELLEGVSRTAHARAVSAFLKELRVLVDQDTVVFAGLVGVVLEAEAVAFHTLDGDVSQEGHELAALPNTLRVDAVSRHCGVNVIGSRVGSVVEKAKRDKNGRRKLSVSERDVHVLASVLRSQEVGR